MDKGHKRKLMTIAIAPADFASRPAMLCSRKLSPSDQSRIAEFVMNISIARPVFLDYTLTNIPRLALTMLEASHIAFCIVLAVHRTVCCLRQNFDKLWGNQCE